MESEEVEDREQSVAIEIDATVIDVIDTDEYADL